MADAATSGPAARVGLRTLVISTSFSILIALVVFSIMSMALIFPVIEAQRAQLGALSARISELSGRIDTLEESAHAAPAPVAPPVVAVAPVAPAPVAK